jgi:hypothetical protein
MEKQIETVFGGLNERRFKYLFLVLLVALFLVPLLWDTLTDILPMFTRVINLLLFFAVLWGSSSITSRNRKVYSAVIIASVVALVLNAVYIYWPNAGLMLANHVIVSVILIHVIAALTIYLFLCKDVTLYTLMAAFCAFLLIALLWTLFYGIIDIIDPAAFKVPAELAADGRLASLGKSGSFNGLYFSMVTITTLGYGDISPLSAEARAVATAEAFVGQMFIAVMIARLVGIYAGQSLAGGKE